MRAIVLSIGSELLRGDIVDTNAAFLARQLSQLGFQVRRAGQIGDDLEELTGAFNDALDAVDVTVCTGGLGPTQDDLTRQAIASALGEEVYIDEALVAGIEQRFGAMGRRMTPNNRQQAQLIPSAKAIPNPNGTAPGWFVRHDGRFVVAMPGPPHEMEPMWNDWVQPRLAGMLAGAVAMRSIVTFGIGESLLEHRIEDVLHWTPDVTVATYAKANGVEVHITARAENEDAAIQLVNETEEKIRQRVGEPIIGVGDATLSRRIGELLRETGRTLAVMESCTGGELSDLITDEPGSSEYFMGGIVAYTRDAKAHYGVPASIMDIHGLISGETAAGMARAAARQFAATYGLGVTGVAGSDSVEGKSPGTAFVAVHGPEGDEVREIHRPGGRSVVKRYVAQCALDLLRRSFQLAERPPA